MRNKNLLSLCLAALVAAAGAAGFAGIRLTEPVTVSAADDTNDDWLHCKGSRLYDKDGNEIEPCADTTTSVASNVPVASHLSSLLHAVASVATAIMNNIFFID